LPKTVCKEMIIGSVDIGGSKIAVGAVTETGKVLSQLNDVTSPNAGFASAMQRIVCMLHNLAAQVGTRFSGIGVACPGPLDPFSGILGNVGTLPGWQGNSLIEPLEREFGVSIAIENDADAAAIAEATWGSGKRCDRFIFITISTGIGGGIVLSGQLYRGVEGAHPELGHQILDASGPLCYCGARGCWEVLASGPALVAWMRENHPAVDHIAAEEICTLAEQGNRIALQAVDREGYYLGLGLANLITLFAPDTIALGGGVMKSSHLFLKRALKVIREVCTQVPANKTRITLASLKSDVGLAGAAQAWLCKYR